jgi:heat shock protein HslJ
MKTTTCILLLAALGCNNGVKSIRQPDDVNTPATIMPASFKFQAGNTLNGRWRLIPVLPSDTATGRIPMLNFILESNRVTGSTGCNSFSGSFNINKNNLTFNHDFVSTKMSCPGYDEAAFERSLLRTDNYEINGDTLSLKENQTPLSYWIRVY